jgi:hypothetical protein
LSAIYVLCTSALVERERVAAVGVAFDRNERRAQGDLTGQALRDA